MHATAFDHADLLASSQGRLFPGGDGRLPAPPMLMFDRITRIEVDAGRHGQGVVEAELDIRPDLWFFGCHFEGDSAARCCRMRASCAMSSTSSG